MPFRTQRWSRRLVCFRKFTARLKDPQERTFERTGTLIFRYTRFDTKSSGTTRSYSNEARRSPFITTVIICIYLQVGAQLIRLS